MTDDGWHATDRALATFAADPRAMDDRLAASIEAHLIGCERCRGVVNERVGGGYVERSWASIAERIDEPRLGVAEHVLRRAGFPDGTARLVGATPALVTAGLLSVALVTMIVVASRIADASGGFLLVAPTVPLLAVATVFAPISDPAGEAGIATPLHGLGLLLRRGAVVVSLSFTALALAELAIGELEVPVAAWLLPSLALTTGSLALGTWIRAEFATGGLAAAWFLLLAATRWLNGVSTSLAESPVFGPGGSAAAVICLAASLAVVVLRRDQFQTMETSR